MATGRDVWGDLTEPASPAILQEYTVFQSDGRVIDCAAGRDRVAEVDPELPAAWFFHTAEELLSSLRPRAGQGKNLTELKWSEARRYVLMRDNRACTMQFCGREEDLTVHHILPRVWGGTHHPGNLITLCTRCHRNLCNSCTRSAPCRVPPLNFPP